MGSTIYRGEVVLCVLVLLTSHSNPTPNGLITKNFKYKSTQVTFQTVGHKERTSGGNIFGDITQQDSVVF